MTFCKKVIYRRKVGKNLPSLFFAFLLIAWHKLGLLLVVGVRGGDGDGRRWW